MKKRIIFDLILLGAIFYSPWWIVAILAFIGAFVWPMYYEIIVFGVIVDVLYGVNSATFGGLAGVLTAIVILFVASYSRKAVR